MAILQSCCCFRTVRKGSFASAIFTLFSDGISVVFMSIFVHEERNYISGNTTQARSTSFVQPETISQTSMTFSIIVLSGACCGLVASFLLIYGLIKNNRIFLIPWIIVVLIKTIIDISHTIYLIILATARLNPVPIILFTLDFFLYLLTLYAFLCVVSQYQELKAGRGRAEDDPSRYPVNYAPQPTATSCLSTRKPATYHETTATEPRSTLVTNDYTMSPMHHPGRKSSAKHVQFGSSEEQTHLNGKKPDDKILLKTACGARTLDVLIEETNWVSSPSTLISGEVDKALLLAETEPSTGIVTDIAKFNFE